ncbi:MAG: ATP-binding cassette domain-containing protein [Firmicutes bacterium]|nr:ATP-binding cassette domain-containing protein [Bacillota bacterium]
MEVEALRRVFRRHEHRFGLAGAVESLVNRRHIDKVAVGGISFSVSEGEMVGFLGPNGAGKTTTLKMLSGLIHPTSGDARVLGFSPWERRSAFLKQISLVMGQKNQLWWDLPAMESFELNAEIYDIPRKAFSKTLSELTSLLGVEGLPNVQVRRLSLGERMKMELIGALLHRPKILFLDEPTIGLDVVEQKRFHEFIREYNRTYGTTVILTSHYMGDVHALCERRVVIRDGKLIYDGRTDSISSELAGYRLLRATFSQQVDTCALDRLGEVVSNGGYTATLRIPVSDVTRVSTTMLASLPVQDFTMEEVPLEEIMSEVFVKGTGVPSHPANS